MNPVVVSSEDDQQSTHRSEICVWLSCEPMEWCFLVDATADDHQSTQARLDCEPMEWCIPLMRQVMIVSLRTVTGLLTVNGLSDSSLMS